MQINPEKRYLTDRQYKVAVSICGTLLAGIMSYVLIYLVLLLQV
jgi:hypothetical protein